MLRHRTRQTDEVFIRGFVPAVQSFSSSLRLSSRARTMLLTKVHPIFSKTRADPSSYSDTNTSRRRKLMPVSTIKQPYSLQATLYESQVSVPPIQLPKNLQTRPITLPITLTRRHSTNLTIFPTQRYRVDGEYGSACGSYAHACLRSPHR